MNLSENMSRVTRILIALSALALVGCVQKQPEPPLVQYVQKDAVVPAGVVGYCWEEPLVNDEANGPGLDPDEHWYHPHYKAVREVRQGRWVPCRKRVEEQSQ